MCFDLQGFIWIFIGRVMLLNDNNGKSHIGKDVARIGF